MYIVHNRADILFYKNYKFAFNSKNNVRQYCVPNTFQYIYIYIIYYY